MRNPPRPAKWSRNPIRFRQLIRRRQWALWRFGRYITDPDCCTKRLSRASSMAITNA
jgi:hypothetical protein